MSKSLRVFSQSHFLRCEFILAPEKQPQDGNVHMLWLNKQSYEMAETSNDLLKSRNQRVKREIKLLNFPVFFNPSCVGLFSGTAVCKVPCSAAARSRLIPDCITLSDMLNCQAAESSHWTWRQREIRDEGNSTCSLILLPWLRGSQACDWDESSCLSFSMNLCIVMM